MKAVMNKKINVLYVVSSLRKCGPTNQLYEIIKYLDKDMFNVRILTLFVEDKFSDIEKFKEAGIRVDSLNFKNTKNYFKIAYNLKRSLKNIPIDIIHSCGLAADFSSCFLRNSIHVSTIRNYAYFDYISAYGKIFGKIMIYLNKWSILHTDYPICCSESIRDMYAKKIKKKIYYIQNGVDVKKYKFIPQNKLKIREEIQVSSNKIMIIVSGSLCERKDPLFILNAISSMNLEDKVEVVFIGEGQLYEECKKYESDNIIFKGAVTDVEKYLNAADVYISASKSEGLPNSVLEAAACGLEVILSNIPQHIEIFKKAPKLANFFELGNQEEFKKCLMKVLENKHRNNKLISQYINFNFSSKRNSEKYAEIYNIILKNREL